METQLALITAEHAYLRSGSGEKDGSNRTGIEDEIFSGWAVEILEDEPEKAYVKVLTHYGYEGEVSFGWSQGKNWKNDRTKAVFSGSVFPKRIFWISRRYRDFPGNCF